MSSDPLTWATLQPLSEEQQAVYWAALVAHWQAAAEREADPDFDPRLDRLQMWGAYS
jgi:hypothetical protein